MQNKMRVVHTISLNCNHVSELKHQNRVYAITVKIFELHVFLLVTCW
jgi:hypothetical protein